MGRWTDAGEGGFSLVELIVTIAVLGVLSVIAIPIMSGVLETSQTEVAQRNLNLLNGAVINYNQSVNQLTNSSGSDSAVVELLKTRDASVPGTPFLPDHFANVTTSDTNAYRAVWNTRVFEMVSKGESGSGIDLLKLSSSQ